VASYFVNPLEGGWPKVCVNPSDDRSQNCIRQGFGRASDNSVPALQRDWWVAKRSGYHLAYDILVPYTKQQQSIQPPFGAADLAGLRKVFAPAAGVVRWVEETTGPNGYWVVIEHELPAGDPDGQFVCSVFFHMVRPSQGGLPLRIRAHVSVGEIIGHVSPLASDDSGTVPHQHYGVRKGAYAGDPSVLNPITHIWYYPGYTTSSPRVGSTDPSHGLVIQQWFNPLDFLSRHSNQPPAAGFTMTTDAVPQAICSAPTCAVNGQTLTVPVDISGVARITFSTRDCSPGPATGCSYDPDGRIASREWRRDGVLEVPTGDPFLDVFLPGTYTVSLKVTDDKGATSLLVQGTIVVVSATGFPTVSIDGALSSSRSQGQAFTFIGVGFTLGQLVTRRVLPPGGPEITLTPAVSADATGRVGWIFPTLCATPPGDYFVRVIDDTTGQVSNTVTEHVAADPTCGATPIFTVLHQFNGTDGSGPDAGLIQASDGNLYGNTGHGGLFGSGTLFGMTLGGVFGPLHSFSGTDGLVPFAELLQGSDGQLYGTTAQGGSSGAGVVFQSDLAGNVTVPVLHQFNGVDGRQPWRLIQLSDRNFYGTTFSSGGSSPGTLFRLDTAGNFNTLHFFTFAEALTPSTGLIQGSDGSLYGTADSGGTTACPLSPVTGCGTVFKTNLSGNVMPLHVFLGPEGAGPKALIQASDGNFYGVARGGGAFGPGSVFKMDPAGNVTLLHSFDGTDGSDPTSLIQASDGNFYGMTRFVPTIFKIDASGNLTTLHVFNGTDGAEPFGTLLQASDGNFYGTTPGGGANNLGVVFQLRLK